MVKYSIISLIYQSSIFADWVYDSVLKYTPFIRSGMAEFFFIANDPTPALKQHLEKKNYPHVLNYNQRYNEKELFASGYGKPEYMSRVYRGYNQGILRAKGDYVVLVNSDNFFSPDWLENLIKYADRQTFISSKLVERKHPSYDIFPGAINGEFGDSPSNFKESEFISFATNIRKTGLEKGGAYMPTIFYRDLLIEAGLYPDGNIAGRSFQEVKHYGDEALFARLASLGVAHYTSLDSIVYHLKEGEKDDATLSSTEINGQQELSDLIQYTTVRKFPFPATIARSFYEINPVPRHKEIISAVADIPLITNFGVFDTVRSRIHGYIVLTLRKAGLLWLAVLFMKYLRNIKKRLFIR